MADTGLHARKWMARTTKQHAHVTVHGTWCKIQPQEVRVAYRQKAPGKLVSVVCRTRRRVEHWDVRVDAIARV